MRFWSKAVFGRVYWIKLLTSTVVLFVQLWIRRCLKSAQERREISTIVREPGGMFFGECSICCEITVEE